MMLKDAPKNVTLIAPGLKIMVLSDYGEECVKIRVIDSPCPPFSKYEIGRNYIVSRYWNVWKIFKEPVQSKVSSATITALETDIKNMEKNIESAKANLEKAKKDLKKSIPALVVGGLYRISEDHHTYQSGTILVLDIVDDEFVKAVQFFDVANKILLDQDLELINLNDGTLIHLNSSEDKKFAKRLFELTKDY